jgi:hypothetical protein
MSWAAAGQNADPHGSSWYVHGLDSKESVLLEAAGIARVLMTTWPTEVLLLQLYRRCAFASLAGESLGGQYMMGEGLDPSVGRKAESQVQATQYATPRYLE